MKMVGLESYQSIRTPDELEEERSIEGIYQGLLDEAVDDSDGRPINSYARMNLMKRAREIYNSRQEEEE